MPCGIKEVAMFVNGLFRLWIVASVLWVALWIVAIPTSDNPNKLFAEIHWLIWVPPMLAFIIGSMLAWVAKGFRSQ